MLHAIIEIWVNEIRKDRNFKFKITANFIAILTFDCPCWTECHWRHCCHWIWCCHWPRGASIHMLNHLQLPLLALLDRRLQLQKTGAQPVHGQVVHGQSAGSQLARYILDQCLIELKEQRRCGWTSAEERDLGSKLLVSDFINHRKVPFASKKILSMEFNFIFYKIILFLR